MGYLQPLGLGMGEGLYGLLRLREGGRRERKREGQREKGGGSRRIVAGYLSSCMNAGRGRLKHSSK